MTVVWLVGAVWLLGTGTGLFGQRRPWGIVLALAVTAGCGAIVGVELLPVAGAEWVWAQILLAGATAAAVLWGAFRRYRRGAPDRFGTDFACVFLATAAAVAVLMILAERLYPRAPFGAVVVGILAFFLPINGLAEVFRAGRNSRRSAGGRVPPARRGPVGNCGGGRR